MNDPSGKLFEEKLQSLSLQLQDNQACDIDENIIQRLRESRLQAINNSRSGNAITLNFPAWLAPVSTVTAYASVALIAASLWLMPIAPTKNTLPLDDLALFSASEELEFYENLDFYIWLESDNDAS